MSADIFGQQILPLFEVNRAAYLASARAVARQIATERGTVTVNDVRKLCPPPPEVDPRVMGAVLRSSEFEKVDYRLSDRAACHHRPIAVFRLRAA